MQRSSRQPRQPRPPREFPPGSVVTALAPSPRGDDFVQVRVGRASAGTLPAAEAAALGILPGAPWTDELRDAMERSKARAKGREYAFKVLAARAISRARLVAKLARRGVDASSAAQIADDLERIGLLNDAAYADAVVRNELLRKPAGKPLLLAKLRQRGVDQQTARAAVDRAVTPETYDALAEATKLAERRLRTMPKTAEPDAVRRRLYALLARRGFDPDTCGKVLRAVAPPR